MSNRDFWNVTDFIPKPVWAVGFALEQTLRDATLAVFSFTNFKTASAYFTYCVFSFFNFLNFSNAFRYTLVSGDNFIALV
ncbi:MAG: hypothetical protein LBH59_07375 [Planctomycetaceae bacterium]|nr:hypothetical protein [Planctomycetaceae bacterium]